MYSRKIFLKIFLTLAIACILQSCILHPPYTRPDVNPPCHWRVEADEASTYANLRWWEQLEDPILNQLIGEALENNKDIKVAIGRVYEYVGLLGITESALFPQINLTGSATRQEISTEVTPLPAGVPRIYNQYNLLINGAYELDFWGKLRSATEASYAELLAQVDARRNVVLTIVAGVASAFIQLKQYDKQLDIARRTFKSRQESYELAQLRFLGGLTSELEAKQSEAEMETAAAQVLNFEVLVAQQENLLSILIGYNPQAIERGKHLDDLHLIKQIPAGLPSELLVQRPDLLRAEELLAAANARIGVARAQLFPSISLTGALGGESLELKNLFINTARTWNYGISFLQPIFYGGQLLSQIEVAKARTYQAYYQYQQTVLNAFREVEDALIAHRKSKELLQVQNRRSAALREALTLATLQYDNGQVDYLNVLDAERNLFASQLDQAEVLGSTFLTLINLYKALGGGWVIDVDQMIDCPTRL